MSISRVSIAIVDDDEGMRKALGRLLRAAGFDIQTFGSAEEFLETAIPVRHSCLILDIKLPGISGLELFRRMREDGTSLPTIFITAQPLEWKVQRATGFVGREMCLHKPFPADSLLGAVESALRSASQPVP